MYLINLMLKTADWRQKSGATGSRK